MRAAAFMVCLLAGCASVPAGSGVLGVGQALQRGDALDGQLVRIEGVLGTCTIAGCELRDAGGRPETIQVGGDSAFANAARRSTGRVVIVQGRFDGTCLHGMAPKAPETGIVACAGRGTPVRSARIIAVR